MAALYIIAGPKGAGKSTHSALLVPGGIEVFDGNKVFAALQQQSPDIDDSQLMERVTNDIFPTARLLAIQRNEDFAYETNFASPDSMVTINQFRANGYSFNLIYIGLESVIRAQERVSLRVAEGDIV